MSNACVATSEPESSTCAVKLKVPVVVGVPLRTPALDRLSPPGSAPADTDHV
jgi:hypothetical protein